MTFETPALAVWLVMVVYPVRVVKSAIVSLSASAPRSVESSMVFAGEYSSSGVLRFVSL